MIKGDGDYFNDDACPGTPSTSTIEENIKTMKKMVSDIRQISISHVTDNVGISFDSCKTIFTDVLGITVRQQ